VVNILDIVNLVGFIVGNLSEVDQQVCADRNADGTIDIQDVIWTIDLILNF
jgi:hypothetical protein